jgi:outer membrane protein assembly factor BamB
MPEVTVVAGGRVFKAFGHRAIRSYQNATINTLYAFSAYNGTKLWTRPLKKGFMIHRNTLIAAPDALYLGDDESCKKLDPATGKVLSEFVSLGEAGEEVWKWMALEDGRLYALVGGPEFSVAVLQGGEADAITRGWGWGRGWPKKRQKPASAFGFGRTLLALDPRDGKVLWSHKEEFPLDGRAVCMKSGRLYAYSPGKFLVCLDAATGRVAWRNSNADLLEAVGSDTRAQSPLTGFLTTAYVKCSAQAILFAGPQRPNLVAVSPADGKLLWKRIGGNLHLILRDDACYAFGPGGRAGSKGGAPSTKIDYLTGKVLGPLPLRTSCTRITASVDSIFARSRSGMQMMTSGACTTWFDPASGVSRLSLIAPMRPACTDGVIVANGSLYLGPWVCGCNSTLFGFLALSPAGTALQRGSGSESRALETEAGFDGPVRPFEIQPGDWPQYRGNAQRTGIGSAEVPREAALSWEAKPPAAVFPTAPVAAGGLVFVGGTDGIVRALDARDGGIVWTAGTGGGIFYPPAIWNGRCFVGSNDGRVYAFEAATGRLLWRFRLAPADRKIPIFGALSSTWPVSCGVVVDDGVLYAAAGLTHYDGVHLYALDAVTGKTRWHYSAPGGAISTPAFIRKKAFRAKTSSDTPSAKGLAPSGNLWLKDRKLQLPAGNFCGVAEFDIETGRLVSTRAVTRDDYRPYGKCYITEMAGGEEKDRPVVFPPTLWRPRLPEFALSEGKIGGREDRALSPTKMTLAFFAPSGAAGKRSRQATWSKDIKAYRGAAVSSGMLLLLGQVQKETSPFSLTALAVKDGALLWSQPLSAAPVCWGVLVDRSGRVVVSLEDGRVVCFAEK